MFRVLNGRRIELVRGNIADESTDAIVNAANSALAGGGGVDGAIHSAAGPSILEETRRRYPDGCPTGSAVATRAGNLKANYLFHAVGPVWRGGNAREEDLLRSAVQKCFALAEAYQCVSVAMPALSTGAYGYPLDLAARVLCEVIRDELTRNETVQLVRVVLWGEGAFGQFARVMEEIPFQP